MIHGHQTSLALQIVGQAVRMFQMSMQDTDPDITLLCEILTVKASSTAPRENIHWSHRKHQRSQMTGHILPKSKQVLSHLVRTNWPAR